MLCTNGNISKFYHESGGNENNFYYYHSHMSNISIIIIIMNLVEFTYICTYSSSIYLVVTFRGTTFSN